MSTLTALAIVIPALMAYAVIGGVAGRLMVKIDPSSEHLDAHYVIGFLWPVAIPIGLAALVIFRLRNILTWPMRVGYRGAGRALDALENRLARRSNLPSARVIDRER